MKTVLIAIGFTGLLAVMYVVSFKGLDLKRRSSWLYGVISLLGGVALIMGLNGNLIDGLKAGGFFAVVTLLGGATMRWHKQRYERMVISLLSQYGKEDDPSLFAKLVRRLLGRYK